MGIAATNRFPFFANTGRSLRKQARRKTPHRGSRGVSTATSSRSPPEKGQPATSRAARKRIRYKHVVRRIAISECGNTGPQKTAGALRYPRDKRETPPKKNQRANGNNNL